MPTIEQQRMFGRVNAGYGSILPTKKQPKPTNGSLWLKGYLHTSNKPFGVLQNIKKDLMYSGYLSRDIKIGY